MGVYDTISVPCPKCGEPYYAQSKSGPCELKDYDLATAPADVLMDVNRHAPFKCDCGEVFEVINGKPTPCEMREQKDYLGLKDIPQIYEE